jgi:hypothetical protein
MRLHAPIAEDDLPAVLLENLKQTLMHIVPVGSDMDKANFSAQHVQGRWKDDDLRPLNINFEIVDEVEGRQELLQCDGTHESQLGHVVMAGDEIAHHTRSVLEQDAAHGLLRLSLSDDLVHHPRPFWERVRRHEVLRTGAG